ncbi:MAG: AAA family ATPase [Burkholderiales bacterium]|nr:AAA family ATPase [Burkholderiales bacterium]
MPPPVHPGIAPLLDQLNRIILGKDRQLRLALACMLARGHLLIEDVPGVGKTTLAHALARSIGLAFQRIQFTSDLLPADVLGASVYDRDSGSFTFHRGPIFAQFILADEVNRATPKTQSALLEAMEEEQVTLDAASHPLPQPFFVIATQNPSYQVGTFALPESQLDRFLMRIALGYPDRAAERELLTGADRRAAAARAAPVLDVARFLALQEGAAAVFAAPALIDYLQALIEASRRAPQFTSGLSPRAGLGLLAAARAWAFIGGRDAVLPEDVQAVLPAVTAHRLRPAQAQEHASPTALVEDWMTSVPLP